MKLKPLEQFVCDECDQIIEKVEDGWLEWFDDGIHPIHGFRIVHYGGKCYYTSRTIGEKIHSVSDMHLHAFMGIPGLAILLNMFAKDIAFPEDLAEIIGRLHIPHYEKIRYYFRKAAKPTIGILYNFGDSKFNPEEFIKDIS